jgi:ADP-ribose pyrophosphatase
MGIEASFGWLRHPPTVLVVPRCADGGLLLLRRYQPAVGRWVLEFPSGVLRVAEAPAAGGARLVRELTGQDGRAWRQLGVLRPNPGYSDEHMTVGMMVVGAGQTVDGPPIPFDARGATELQRCSPADLDVALMALDQAVDGRCVSAWVLARPHWGI